MTMKLALALSGFIPKTVDLGAAPALFSDNILTEFGDGSSNNSDIDLVYADSFSAAASSTQTYDLRGSLTMNNGTSAVFVDVAAIIIVADSTNTNNVVFGAGSNPVDMFSDDTDSLPIKPGGWLAFCVGGGGVTTAAGTADIITLTNSSSGSAVTGRIYILGRSA